VIVHVDTENRPISEAEARALAAAEGLDLEAELAAMERS